jgi:hypothetical protein
MEKIVVEIELSSEESEKFKYFVERRCLDREKYLKKLLSDSLLSKLNERERLLALTGRANAEDRFSLQGK